MAGPGDYLDPSLWPLFLQSGMMQAPPQGRTAPPELDMNDPFARAAYRQQQSVRPDFGRAGEGPSIPDVLMSAMPGGMITKAATAAPKTMAAVLGMLGASAIPSQAGEQTPFNWSDPNIDRVKRLDTIDKLLQREASRSTKSAPGTQKALMDSLNEEKQKLLEGRSNEYNSAFAQYQSEQQKALDEAAAQKRAETSWFDMIPGSRSALTAAAPIASYLGGKYIGKRMGMGPAMATGAAGGGIEGFLSQYIPTEMDVAGLPRGSATQQRAAGDLQDPNYWMTRVAPSTGGSALTGAYGAFRGALGRRAPLPPILPSSPGAPPAMLGSAPGAIEGAVGNTAVPGLGLGPARPSSPPYFDKKVGQWRQGGKFVKAPSPGNPPPLLGE